MRYIFSFCLAFLLVITALFTCGKDTEENNPVENNLTPPPAALPGTDGFTQTKVVIDEATGETSTVEKPTYALSTMIGPSPNKRVDEVPPKVYYPQPQTAQEQRVVNVLTKNYWVVQTLVRVNDRPANVQNQGAWFQFHANGMYDYGFFKEKIASGAWTFDGQNALLHLDSELVADDREWEVKMSSEEDLMIWVGNQRYHTNDIQMRLYNFIQTPRDRGEMGLDEKNGRVN